MIIKENALELHEKLIHANPNIPDAKKRYAIYLSEVVGNKVDVLEKKKDGYVIRTINSKKKIFVPNEFVAEN